MVYLSIGSNLGDKVYNILMTLKLLNDLKESQVVEISSFYETEAFGYENQENFYNIAIKLKTNLLPYELLEKIWGIETKLRRKRIIKWGPRSIDIDIILYKNLNINSEKLTIPHKEYKKRNFVLYPLLEIIDDKTLVLNYLKEAGGKIKKLEKIENILVSACLLGINTKYNGGNNFSIFAKKLLKPFNIIPICPEQLGGMPTPRKAVELKEERVFNKAGEEFTKEFLKGAEESLKISKLTNSKIAILKSKSPSCAYGKIYDGSFQKKTINKNGVTAELLLKNGIKIIIL